MMKIGLSVAGKNVPRGVGKVEYVYKDSAVHSTRSIVLCTYKSAYTMAISLVHEINKLN